MLVYLIVALFPLLIGFYYHNKVAPGVGEETQLNRMQLKRRAFWLTVAALPMFALIAFRGSYIGADTLVYQKFFSTMVETPWSRIFVENHADFEVGYVVFEKIVASFTDSSEVFLVVHTAIYLWAVVHFANQLEKANFLFLYFFATLGLYTFMFTAIRQCLAMCTCLFSYKYIRQRKIVPFMGCLILAFLFHKSAILFLAAFFIYPRKMNFLNSVFYSILGLLFYLNIEPIQEWMNEQLDYAYEIEETGNGVIFLLVVIAIMIFSFFMFQMNHNMTYNAQGLINISIITLILWVLRLATRVAERPSFYFLFFTAALLGHGIESMKRKQDKHLIGLIVIAFTMILYVYRFWTNFSSMVPYESFI
ncbi:MAG: EpsG family protein [Clostridia bacterium]|nr:EpsG family protein [Clostridia bacterium]